MSTDDAMRQTRLRTIEGLSDAYNEPGVQPLAEGYYSSFLTKLYRILFGAAEDFGLQPHVFYIVSVVAPLGHELRGIGIVTKDNRFRNGQAVEFFLREALRDLTESEPTSL